MNKRPIPFLKSVAKYYASKQTDLSNYLFLFPNKRSGTFFLKYLREELGKEVAMAPATLTISDFVTELSGRIPASKTELLFILFHCYEKYLKNFEPKGENSGTRKSGEEEKSVTFDSFRKWGETVLNDFNTVDQYLVDPDEVFKNVKDYKEIQTDFLTDDQKEVLEEFFGFVSDHVEGDFWKNFEEEEEKMSSLKQSFIHLWRLLGPLYHDFNEELEKKGLISSGGAYRFCHEKIKNEADEVLTYDKIAVIGFNALSTSEKSIFKELKKLKTEDGEPYCDFFWDSTGPVLEREDNSASRFVKADIKKFPAPEDAMPFLRLSDTEDFPEITVIASPSNASQAKIAGHKLGDLKEKIDDKDFAMANVAVVLPDEGLLLPMLYSLPENIENVNLTMGYSFRLTSLFSFLQLLKRLMVNSHGQGEDKEFYHKDLRRILSHPYAYILFPAYQIKKFKGKLDKFHTLRVKLKDLVNEIKNSDPVFSLPGENDGYFLMTEYLNRLFDSLLTVLRKRENDNFTKIEVALIETALSLLTVLNDLIEEYEMDISAGSFLRLFEKTLSSEKIMFEGEPLKGLQVMGTLETRSLDFDYLFILSMNERIMPRRMRTKSFIPDSLRYDYGMPPSNYSEELFSYYFYRMISRARKVVLLYDARVASGLRTSGESRYILQLNHLFAKGKMKKNKMNFILIAKEEKRASIIKDDEIKRELEKFTEENGKNFSASILGSYRECELSFYLKALLNVNDDPAPSESLDPITTGNVIHNVIMQLYVPDIKKQNILLKDYILNQKYLDDILNDEIKIKNLITREINARYFQLSEKELDRILPASFEMIGANILNEIKTIVEYDKKFAPIELLGVELDYQLPVELKNGRKVNFKFKIDRLDRINDKETGERRLRIIDYKTGSKKNEADSIEHIFEGHYKAAHLFQLLTYAWLLEKINKVTDVDKSMLEIYHLPDMKKDKRGFPCINKKPVKSYSEYSEEFSERFEKMINEIFEKEAFETPKDSSRCQFCNLKAMCGR